METKVQKALWKIPYPLPCPRPCLTFFVFTRYILEYICTLKYIRNVTIEFFNLLNNGNILSHGIEPANLVKAFWQFYHSATKID